MEVEASAADESARLAVWAGADRNAVEAVGRRVGIGVAHVRARRRPARLVAALSAEWREHGEQAGWGWPGLVEDTEAVAGDAAGGIPKIGGRGRRALPPLQ